MVAAAEVPVSAVHGAVLQVVGQADAPLPQQETWHLQILCGLGLGLEYRVSQQV